MGGTGTKPFTENQPKINANKQIRRNITILLCLREEKHNGEDLYIANVVL